MKLLDKTRFTTKLQIKSKLFLSFLIMIIANNSYSQSINWTRIYHDGAGKPTYTGGITGPSTVFTDIDGDGDKDCFVGCWKGTISYFENIGTEYAPVWHFVTDEYNGIHYDYLSISNITFVDIDSDGDLDMFVGGYLTSISLGIHFFRNTGNINAPVWALETTLFGDITTANTTSNFCKPSFTDIDNDGDYDLFFGNFNGNIVFYENTGNNTVPAFTFISDDYFNWTSLGYGNMSRPEFIDIDNDGDQDCFVSVAYSLIFVENTGNQNVPVWNIDTLHYEGITGFENIPDFCDIDGDGDFDMFINKPLGQIAYYENTTTANTPAWVHITDNPLTIIDLGSNCYPAFCDIDGDGAQDMFIVTNKTVWYYHNIALPTNDPVWDNPETPSFMNVNNGVINSISFTDMDNDNDFDLLAGLESDSIIICYENIGNTTNPLFDSTLTIEIHFNGGNGCSNFVPAPIDIDADNDIDLFISTNGGSINGYPFIQYYSNEGIPPSPAWIYSSTKSIYWGKADFMDEDSDGDYDLFLGCFSSDLNSSRIVFYKNTGTIYDPVFELETLVYEDINFEGYHNICFHDIDNDGDKDMIIGESEGGISLFRNDGPLTQISTTKADNPLTIKNYPNPFSSKTTIFLSDKEQIPYKLIIFTSEGQKVRTIDNIRKHNYIFEKQNLKPGSYFYQIIGKNGIIYNGKLVIK